MNSMKSNFIVCVFWTLIAFIAAIINTTLLEALAYSLIAFINSFGMWILFYMQYKKGELCR